MKKEIRMSGRDLDSAERKTLEGLIDSCTLTAVLEALCEVCGEKAEHIREAYQDMTLARKWDTAAGVCGIASTNVGRGI